MLLLLSLKCVLQRNVTWISQVRKRNPNAAFVGLCVPTGILLNTEKLCWEVTRLPSPHQKVTLHRHYSVLPQTTGAYSCFKQTTKAQKAQDELGTLSKEYLNWVPWNLFASIQERLIQEYSRKTKLSWVSRKSGLPEERAWALQPTQKYSVMPWDQAVLEVREPSRARPPHYPSLNPKSPQLLRHWFKQTPSSREALETENSACVYKVSSCNQWKKQQSSSWP